MEKKSQVMKKASEVLAGLGTDTGGIQHLSENDLLLKGRDLRGEWDGAVEARALPQHPLQFWVRALNSTQGHLSIWRIIWLSTAPQICSGFAAQPQECLTCNR